MDIRGRPLRDRVFNTLFAAALVFVGVSFVGKSPNWTVLLIGVSLLFGLELFDDVFGRYIRGWRVS